MPHRRRLLTYAIAAATAATAGFVFPPGATAAAPGTVTSDFNGDGYADLAVGVPDGTVADQAKAGYVNVVWGGPKGVGAHGSIRVTQATPEVPGSPEAGDRFGASVTLTDLNGDGIAELLAGAPGEDVTERGTDAGMVIAVGGSKTGPGPGSTVLTGPSPSAAYGKSIAAANLTGGDNKAIVVGGTDKVVARVIVGEDSMVTTVVAAPMGGRAPVLATGDFDSDGTADLATRTWRSVSAVRSPTRTSTTRAAPRVSPRAAPSTCTTEAPRAARSAPVTRPSTRTPKACRGRPRTVTASVPPSPSPTSTVTAGRI
ncbi:FG-GAP repeat protein [Streptomyces sp. NPDC051214]|uniref:FG-GAP and VCBS repeat-containing protein n=1 Tax=Streptomyces sp. NPDC051214 TaxID=3155282 RepID=UPI00341E6E6B